MAFFLKREHGETFEVKGICFEIHKITKGSVTLRIVSDDSFRVNYRRSKDIAERDDGQAKIAEQVHIGRLRFRHNADHT